MVIGYYLHGMREMNKGYRIIIILGILFGLIEAVLIVSVISQNRITPNDEFFVEDIGDSPEIDADLWRLSVDGLVANELSLTYDNITSFPSINEIVTLRCVDGPTGTADWKGVRLGAVLDMAGVLPNATEVVFYAADGYSSCIA